MRSKSEIIKDLHQTENLCNRLIMEIGEGYAKIRIADDNSLVGMVNQKIETLKKAEIQLKALEQELANSTE